MKASKAKTRRIIIDWHSSGSIKKAEEQKARLENKGFNLIETIPGLNTSKLIYSR